MTNNISTNLPPLSDAIQVPLGMDAHAFARKFAAEQTDLEKKRQVYLNTLAVYAVHSYLNWIEIESDLGRSDSWDALMRRTGTARDLYLSDVQEKIECCPVLPGESSYSVGSELLAHRMGCFPVVFGDRLDYVQLPGFAKLSNYVMLYRSGFPQFEETPKTQAFGLDECFALEEFPGYQTWWKSEMPRTGPINVIHLVLKRQLMEEHLQAGMRGRPVVKSGALAGGFETKLNQLRKTFNIPQVESWGFCQDIQLNGYSFELMTAAWQAVTDAHWSVVLLLRDRYDDALPKGLHLEVKQPGSNHGPNRVLLSKELTSVGRLIFGNDDHPIDSQVGDRLAITVSFDGYTEKLPMLVFEPI